MGNLKSFRYCNTRNIGYKKYTYNNFQQFIKSSYDNLTAFFLEIKPISPRIDLLYSRKFEGKQTNFGLPINS